MRLEINYRKKKTKIHKIMKGKHFTKNKWITEEIKEEIK